MIKALIFDFDGLILDTESVDLHSWQEIYREYDIEFPADRWTASLGRSMDLFDPSRYLSQMLDHSVNEQEIRLRIDFLEAQQLENQPPLPGVREMISDAKELGLLLAVASSSPREWVIPHLSRLNLISQFNCIKCGDEVAHTKPEPDLFCAVLNELDLEADQAIVFEDSPNGVLAANRAGIFCVAVPNAVTSQLPFGHEDMRVNSMQEISLDCLIQVAQSR